VTNGPGVNAPGHGKPPWLKVRLAGGPNFTELRDLMRERSLHTVCEEAMCPNIGECWEEREATFLLLGSTCTRRCGFCDVMTARPDPVAEDEPVRIADAVRAMGLRYFVITGAARDEPGAGGSLGTTGQYLQPPPFHLPVGRWVTADEFAEHKRAGEEMGIRHVEAGPLVRSSYHAGKQFLRATSAFVGS